MRKFIIIGIGWVAVLLTLIIAPKLTKILVPKIIEKEIPVLREVIVEKIVEKPVFKGEKIVEKIVYTPTEVEGVKIDKEGEGYVISLPDGSWDVQSDGKRLIVKKSLLR